MGVWTAGNFDNDEAMDYAHELVDTMIEQIESTIASEHGMEPDEPESARLMCNVDLIRLIGEHTGLSLPAATAVEIWKANYMATWDAYIDGLAPRSDFKEQRRAVIVESFDRLIALSRSQEHRV